MLHGNFAPNPRDIALRVRLEQYYSITPDSMPNQIAFEYYLEFMRWCAKRGYTQDEINKARRNVQQRGHSNA